jgi:hypothetical protein
LVEAISSEAVVILMRSSLSTLLLLKSLLT